MDTESIFEMYCMFLGSQRVSSLLTSLTRTITSLVIKNGEVELILNGFFVGQAINTDGMYQHDLSEDGGDTVGYRHGVSLLDIEFSNGESISDSNCGVTTSDSSSTSSNDVTNSEVNEITFSAYIACSISLWHKHLAHKNI